MKIPDDEYTTAQRWVLLIAELILGLVALMLIWDVLGWKIALAVFLLTWAQNLHNRREL